MGTHVQGGSRYGIIINASLFRVFFVVYILYANVQYQFSSVKGSRREPRRHASMGCKAGKAHSSVQFSGRFKAGAPKARYMSLYPL